MAKVLFTAAVADARGKLNGTVFSKNRGGAYIRTKVTPVNAQTDAQQGVRAALSSAAQGWRDLTDAQRAAWNGAVENFKRTDIFGNSRNPSGFNLYMRLGLNGNLIFNVPNDLPPLPTAVSDPGIISAVADASGSTIALTFANAPVPAGTAMVVFATPQVSPGKKFVKNLYRKIAVLDPTEASPYALGAEYETKFGDLVAGNRIGIKAFFIDQTSYITGIAQSCTTIVVA